MPSVETTLTSVVPVHGMVNISVPKLRSGDITPGTRTLTMNGVPQPETRYSIDFTLQTVSVQNESAVAWPVGAKLVLTWTGFMIEPVVNDLQTRTTTLEAKMGVTDGSNALPGQIGEYVVQANTTGVALTSDVPLTVCQISLTPGVWEIWGSGDFVPPSNKSPNLLCAAISQRANDLPTDNDLYSGIGIMTLFYTTALTSGQRQVLMTGQCRANSAIPLILYLVAKSSWTGGGTITVKGYISARRVR